MRPRHLNTLFDRAIERAGVPRIRLHDLRHTCATLMLEVGVDYESVSAIFGHASAAVTLSVYAHFTATMGEQAAGRIDAVFR